MEDLAVKLKMAEAHCKVLLKRQMVRKWHENAQISIYEYTLKTSTATVHYLHKILRISFRSWQEVQQPDLLTLLRPFPVFFS